MDEQLYPLCPGYNEDGRNMSVPLQVNVLGYYHGKCARTLHRRVRRIWTLTIVNYRERPGSDPEMMEVGQFLLHRPDELCTVYKPDQETIGYYWIYFTGFEAEELLNYFHLEGEKVYTLPEDCLAEVRRDFDQMLVEAARKRPGYQRMLTYMLSALIVRLGRGCREENPEKSDLAQKRMESSLLYIQGNYSDSTLDIATLAQKLHLSESRYRKLFRETQGISPVEYITQLRIAHACDLLQNTAHTISQVAQYCGYPDISYFCRLFRKRMGMSPSEFRKSKLNT